MDLFVVPTIGFDLLYAFVIVRLVGLMVLYGVMAYQLPKVRMRLDRLGDNFYYLGFLYTLASLAVLSKQRADADLYVTGPGFTQSVPLARADLNSPDYITLWLDDFELEEEAK